MVVESVSFLKISVNLSNKLDGENIIGIKTKKGTVTKESKVEEETKNYPEVEKFLEEIGMQKYLNIFINNGFEDLGTILELRDEDFNIMGLPLGHKLKMLKKIKELKGGDNVVKKVSVSKAVSNKDNEEKAAEVPKKAVHFGDTNVVIEIDKEPKMVSNETNTEALEIKEFKTPTKEPLKVIEKVDTETLTNPPTINSNNEKEIVLLNIRGSKESCWNCYKLFIKDKGYIDPLTENVFTSL